MHCPSALNYSITTLHMQHDSSTKFDRKKGELLTRLLTSVPSTRDKSGAGVHVPSSFTEDYSSYTNIMLFVYVFKLRSWTTGPVSRPG